MSFIRPELRATIHRWREVIAGLAATLPGLWIFSFGGFFWMGIGALIVAAGLALAINAARRQRFERVRDAPGVVQMVEGQLAYFAPEHGGFAALDDVAELRLERGAAGRSWVLVQTDATELHIPVAARGTEVLFDAFAKLPGIDMGAVLRTLDQEDVTTRVVWRRHARTALT